MSRRRTAAQDQIAQERRRAQGDRRDDEQRRRLEMLLDRWFRPAQWAARAAYTLGLQSARPVIVQEHVVIAERSSRPPIRIAFASDFHAGATTDDRVMRSACEALSALQPDVLLLGGDFVSVRAHDIHRLAPLLAAVRAPLGTFAVFGNHDLRSNNSVVAGALREAGVRMLVNEVVRLAPPHEDIAIIGLDDPIGGAPDATVLDTVRAVRVVLMHAPDGLLALGDRDFDVALAGHTHGGQIVLPGGVKPYLPHGQLSRKFAAGTYRLGPGSDRTLIVSRGVGCSTVPVRVLCGAEVHLVTVSSGSPT